MDFCMQMESFGPVIAAAMVEQTSVAVGLSSHMLPIVQTRSVTDVDAVVSFESLEQQQSSDLYGWLFGKSTTMAKMVAQPENVVDTTNLPSPVPQQSESGSEAEKDRVTSSLPEVEAPIPVGLVLHQSASSIESSRRFSLYLPPVGPGRRSFDGEERCCPLTPHLTNARIRMTPLPCRTETHCFAQRQLLAGYR
jgi:hypothetical protein